MPKFIAGQTVTTEEHPHSIGVVQRVNGAGDVTVKWYTPEREGLPFGHVATEFWPCSEAGEKILVFGGPR